MQLLYAYKSHCCLSPQTLHQIWILSTSNPGTLTPFFRQEVVEEQGEEDKNLALKLPLNLPYKFIFPLERLLERIWEKGKKMSNSIHSISRRKTSRILKLSKEHQLGQQTNKHNMKREMKDQNHYMPPLKNMTCVVFVSFFQGILLLYDLAMLCQKHRQEALHMGWLTHN